MNPKGHHPKAHHKQAGGHGLARVLSKRGFCSRAEAVRLVLAGRVTVDGRVVRDPEARTRVDHPGLAVDGRVVGAAEPPVYVMLNKPRGLVTSAADELGRETVFQCLAGSGLPRLVPVGRLDKASEGLLLFTNDTAWADRLTDPAADLPKIYHVQVKPAPDEEALERMCRGVEVEPGETWGVEQAGLLRSGGITAWLEITLTEGKNRQIRRILEALGFETLRLVRVAVGPLVLGDLPKGQWRVLSAGEAAGF